MINVRRVALTAALFGLVSTSAMASRAENAAPRNNQQANGAPAQLRAAVQPSGTGLAPTTWGYVSSYSGSLYGTGYYAFRVDNTYNGNNSIYGYTFQYPSIGFVNDIRAVYVFDISGLLGEPSPLWSAFMFDARETPPDGSSTLMALADVQINQSGTDYTLDGLSLRQSNGGDVIPEGTAIVDVYDAEDFEDTADFSTPEDGFSGASNTLIANFSSPFGTVTPFSINITGAIDADAPAGNGLPPPLAQPDVIPAAGSLGKGLIALVLLLTGAWMIRRR
ncbi:MAG: hypothetical protein R3F04_10960 [Lysobacteraceae bacterium]